MVFIETGDIFWKGIHKLSERWEKCVESDGKYFKYTIFIDCIGITDVLFFSKKSPEHKLPTW